MLIQERKAMELISSFNLYLRAGSLFCREFIMSRPMALGLVLLVLILTSQSDWKQDSKPELEEISSPVTKRELPLTNLEVVRREVRLRKHRFQTLRTERIKTSG